MLEIKAIPDQNQSDMIHAKCEERTDDGDKSPEFTLTFIKAFPSDVAMTGSAIADWIDTIVAHLHEAAGEVAQFDLILSNTEAQKIVERIVSRANQPEIGPDAVESENDEVEAAAMGDTSPDPRVAGRYDDTGRWYAPLSWWNRK